MTVLKYYFDIRLYIHVGVNYVKEIIYLIKYNCYNNIIVRNDNTNNQMLLGVDINLTVNLMCVTT